MKEQPDKIQSKPVVFGAAIQGSREEQQDSFRLWWLEAERAWLLVLADGMGGHTAGGVASRIAADDVVSSFIDFRQQGSQLKDSLYGAINTVNASLAKAQLANEAYAGMGTTLVVGHLSSRGIAWISVGDSPMWLYRNGSIHRLNEDHSLRRMPGVANGSRNMLQSALTGQPIPLIDCHPEPVPLDGDDLVLVGSDGLLTLSEDLIASTIEKAATPNPELLTWLLLHAVEDRQRAKQDNCTLIIANSLPPPAFAPLAKFTRILSLRVVAAAVGGAAILFVAGLIWIFR